MVAQLTTVHYPESDGKPMADNTKQFHWITVIKQNLDWLFAQDPTVFVAGDLFWYPVEGRPNIVTAPDVLVVFGRPKGDRGSYKQWEEEHVAPQVVFEILSPSNSKLEMEKKLIFYDRYGVEEYYIYDPDRIDFTGYQRTGERLVLIETVEDWVSPRLQIRFVLTPTELKIYDRQGNQFVTLLEVSQQVEQERQRAEQERQRANQAELEIARLRALLQQGSIDHR